MKLFNKAIKTIQEAKAKYLADNPRILESSSKTNADINISCLPDEYDNVPYCTIVNGKMVQTVGEYKTECAKFDATIY